MYDYIIIGSGLFGSVFAREMTDVGKKCLVLEKRNHIGGNIYTEKCEGITFHKYGAHIFHTSNKNIWDYVNKFCEFNTYKHKLHVNYKNNVYSFPINLMTFQQLYGINSPSKAKEFLNFKKAKITAPSNFEEYALSCLGTDLYEIFIKKYTKKQWMMDPKDLPISIFKRLPIRFDFNDLYYNDLYQGIPIGGYTNLIKNLLTNIEVILNVDYMEDKNYWDLKTKKILFTGPIDRFYNYKYGKLEYRTNDFTKELLEIEDFQGISVMNYTDDTVEFTRIFEYKHFENLNLNYTLISKDYPKKWSEQSEPYYPINDRLNNEIYEKYKDLSKLNSKYIFGGRLAEYKYYDMHQVIGSALNLFKKEIIKNI